MLRTLAVVVLGCLFVLGVLPTFAQPDALVIQRLISQLGSAQYGERQQAITALQTAGAPALDALRAAAQSPDLEVRSRAQELVVLIERRQETARLLASAPVELAYQDTPFADAVRDFEQRTGFRVRLPDDVGTVGHRTVTLKTTADRWQAVEQFCAAAGVVEVGTRPLDNPVVYVHLGNGKAAPKLPTAYLGKLRLRALPPAASGWGQTPGVVETHCKLELATSAGIVWSGVPDVRVQRAVDEHGQVLEQIPPTDAADIDSFRVTTRGNDRDTWMFVDDVPEAAVRVPVGLRLAAKPSRVVKEMQGTLFGRVETMPEQLVVVDDVRTAANRTFTGKDGCTLRVGEVTRDDPNVLKVDIDYVMPLPERPGNITRLNRAWVIRRAAVELRGDAGSHPAIELRDTDGAVLETARYNEVSQRDGHRFTYAATLHILRGSADPVRLAISGRRLVTVEVPFTLRDIPLP